MGGGVCQCACCFVLYSDVTFFILLIDLIVHGVAVTVDVGSPDVTLWFAWMYM